MPSWFQKFLGWVLAWIVLIVGIHYVTLKESFVGTLRSPSPWSGEELTEVNKGQAPWLHSSIHQSNISDPVIKYKHAYYYEMTNQEYESALKTLFSMKSCNTLAQALEKSQWTDAMNPGEITKSTWAGVYEQWMKEFTKAVNASIELKLSGDASKIQVVHDRWIAAYFHVTDPTLLRIDMEVLLYRYGKPHGKHVSMSIIAKRKEADGIFASTNDWHFTVVAIEVLGIVPEDQIAIHPVVANNPFDAPEMSYEEDPKTFENTIIPPGSEVLAEIRRRTALNVATAEAKKKLGDV